MEHQGHGGEEAFDVIDADAVCEQCSTVNPAGTLLCKTCGNNLRDQRARRLADDVGMEALAGTGKPRRVLSALLLVFGLLTITWSVINVLNGNIELWLTKGLSGGSDTANFNPAQFWEGDEARLYADLSSELEQSPVTVQEVASRPADMPVRESIDGRYALLASDGGSGPILGGALARTQGETVYFVARLDGDEIIEIRGKAEASGERDEEGVRQFDAPAAGVMIREEILDAAGYGRLQTDGSVNCYGLVPDVTQTPYFFVAQPLP
ncbi:MAG: hypothetical protein IT365_17775 [Candidatus Hydrogenedentes bacterium]|nr:hypothetical protein [Candidatus Hydrogenedentota bacterium]